MRFKPRPPSAEESLEGPFLRVARRYTVCEDDPWEALAHAFDRCASPRARRAPMSSAQASSLQRLGVPVPADATKGEASDLIALADGIRRLDRLTTRAA